MNPSKAKGTAAETAVVRYLHEEGFPQVERRTLSGSYDRGDVAGLTGIAVEVKACRTMALGSWVDESQVEKVNAEARIGVVWHKRIRHSNPGDWFVTMTGADFVQLLKDAGQ